jgi:hypothetical protein
LKESDFAQRVDQLRGDMVSRASGRLADDMTRAAKTLRRLLSATSASVRLGAARTILETAAKLRETTVLEQRLRALEEQAARRKEKRP